MNIYTREEKFRWLKRIKGEWIAEVAGIKLKLSLTDFGHLGVFPEQKDSWEWIRERIKGRKNVRVLNLFAYSGGATLAAAQAGAEVCHLDASKGMVDWARGNATLNQLDHRPIRWIVDDVTKFLLREIRRKRQYDGIILDPPTYGRGSQGQVFKFENDLITLLKQCRDLLSEHPLFFLLSCHSPGITPIGLNNVLEQTMQGFEGTINHGEMLLTGESGVFSLPNGIFARWHHE